MERKKSLISILIILLIIGFCQVTILSAQNQTCRYQTTRDDAASGFISEMIQDNDPGIPDEIKDNILQSFFTTKKGTAGTGLGLSITNDIIKAHGSEISIESAVTTFVIKISNVLKTLINHG